MSEERRLKLCSDLNMALKDEKKASTDYVVLAERQEDEMLAILLLKLADDEHSHDNAISKAMKIIGCPIE